jgi:hypothetical protein
MEKWQEAGQPEAKQVLREKTQAMIQDLSSPQDYEEMIGKGEEYIKSLC